MSTLRFGLIGDIHAQFGRLEPVLEHLAQVPDLAGVLLVGDVSRDPPWHLRGQQNDAQVQSFAAVLAFIQARLGLMPRFVPGNHDPRYVPLPGNLDGCLEALETIRIFGIGGAGPARFGFPYEWDEAEILAIEVPECDVLLVHCPPLATPIDALSNGRGPAGSAAIRAHAEHHRGVLICGHIHEAAGFALLGACLCINVGALGEPYGRACVGVLEVESRPQSTTWRATLTELSSGASRSEELRLANPAPV